MSANFPTYSSEITTSSVAVPRITSNWCSIPKRKDTDLPYLERPREASTPWHTFKGADAFSYEHENLAMRLTKEAVTWIDQRAKEEGPFFLYFALLHRNIHGPIKPNPQFRGTSEIGIYGDFIHELDWSVGQVLDALDRHGLTDNTIVWFSSDNGAVERRYKPTDLVDYSGHHPNGPWRGQKTEAYEDDGHRVPLIVRWIPNHVQPGSESTQLVALTDVLATVAELIEHPGAALPEDAGEDSFSFLRPCSTGRRRNRVVRQLSTTVTRERWPFAKVPGRTDPCPARRRYQW